MSVALPVRSCNGTSGTDWGFSSSAVNSSGAIRFLDSSGGDVGLEGISPNPDSRPGIPSDPADPTRAEVWASTEDFAPLFGDFALACWAAVLVACSASMSLCFSVSLAILRRLSSMSFTDTHNFSSMHTHTLKPMTIIIAHASIARIVGHSKYDLHEARNAEFLEVTKGCSETNLSPGTVCRISHNTVSFTVYTASTIVTTACFTVCGPKGHCHFDCNCCVIYHNHTVTPESKGNGAQS